MLIRKLFKFENAHIVRGCSSLRCKESIHGHSYKVELIFESKYLDNGQMVYDFGLMKGAISELIDSFDHAATFWNEDKKEYVESIKNFSQRWISLPVSPSAEQFCRVIFLMIDKLLKQTRMTNKEKGVHLQSVIVHETDTGYAQGFKEDAYSEDMGLISLKDIRFSKQVQKEWSDPLMWEKLTKGKVFTNPENI